MKAFIHAEAIFGQDFSEGDICQWHAELNKPLLHGLEEKQNVAKTRKYTSKVIDRPGFPALSEPQYFNDSYNKEIPSEEEHSFMNLKVAVLVG